MAVQANVETEEQRANEQTRAALYQTLQIMMQATFTAPFRQPVNAAAWHSNSASIAHRYRDETGKSHYIYKPLPAPRFVDAQSNTYKVFSVLADCVHPDQNQRSYKGELGMIGVGFIEIDPKDFLEAFAGIAAKIDQAKRHPSLMSQDLHEEVKDVVAAIFGVERFQHLESALSHQNLAEEVDHSRVWLKDAIDGALQRLKDPEVPRAHSDRRDLIVWGKMLNLAEELKPEIGKMVARDVIDANVTKVIAVSAKAETGRLDSIEWGSWAAPLQGLLHGLKAGVDDLQTLERNSFYQTKRDTPYHKGNGIAEFATMVANASDTFKSYIPPEEGERVPEPKIDPMDRMSYADIAFVLGNSGIASTSSRPEILSIQ